ALYLATPCIQIGRKRCRTRVGRDPQLVPFRAGELLRARFVLGTRVVRRLLFDERRRLTAVARVTGVSEVVHFRLPARRREDGFLAAAGGFAGWAEIEAIGRAVLPG